MNIHKSKDGLKIWKILYPKRVIFWKDQVIPYYVPHKVILTAFVQE